jgi:hypothetical protein
MPATLAAPPTPARRWRTGRWWALLAVVALAHVLLIARLAEDRIGWGAADRVPARIDVAFVRELQAAAPPVAAPAAAAPAKAARLPAVAEKAAAPARAASAAEPTEADGPVMVSAPAVPDVLPVSPPAAAAASAAAEPAARASAADTAPQAAVAAADSVPASPAAPAVAPVAPAAASAVAFDWPPSTRLSFILNGYYRGPVNGRATVEWLRQGERYQVRMGTSIGPVLSRNIVSEGVLGAQGLAPQRFTGEQKVLFRSAKRWGFTFEPARVVLDDGSAVGTAVGVQDEASQFVQLTWLFTTRPERLRVGQTIELPLLINRNITRWVYDVVEEETLNFPFGAVPTFHVKPRRDAAPGDLTAEMWIAPTLQYLPVRILIRQGTESTADLTLERAPEQAAR